MTPKYLQDLKKGDTVYRIQMAGDPINVKEFNIVLKTITAETVVKIEGSSSNFIYIKDIYGVIKSFGFSIKNTNLTHTDFYSEGKHFVYFASKESLMDYIKECLDIRIDKVSKKISRLSDELDGLVKLLYHIEDEI